MKPRRPNISQSRVNRRPVSIAQKIPTPQENKPAHKKTIEVRLQLPHINARKAFKKVTYRFKRSGKKLKVALAVIVLVLGSLVVLAVVRTQRSSTAATTSTSPSNPLDQLKKGTPKYATMLPKGKSIEDLGGWTQISPPEREPVYAYVDKIGSVPISVSQQPLPATFKTDPDTKVRDLAMAQNADKSISIGTKKGYIGTSKNGPQSVIFNTDTLLILIKSSSVIPDKDWEAYIESLR